MSQIGTSGHQWAICSAPVPNRSASILATRGSPINNVAVTPMNSTASNPARVFNARMNRIAIFSLLSAQPTLYFFQYTMPGESLS